MIDPEYRLYTVDGRRVRWNKDGYGDTTEHMSRRHGERMIYCWLDPVDESVTGLPSSWFYTSDGTDARARNHEDGKALPALTNTPPIVKVGERFIYCTEPENPTGKHVWEGRTGTVTGRSGGFPTVIFDLDPNKAAVGVSQHRLHPLYPDEDPQPMLNPDLPIVAFSSMLDNKPATYLGKLDLADGRTVLVIKMNHQPQYNYWVDPKTGNVVPKYEGDGSFSKGRFINKREPVVVKGTYRLLVDADPSVLTVDVTTTDGKVTDVEWKK